MAHHERQKGQSKERFKLVGGMHTRRVRKKGEKTEVIRIRRGDTCHITRREAENFPDKFELIRKPVTIEASFDDDEETATDSAVVTSTETTDDSDESTGTTDDLGTEESETTTTGGAAGPLARDQFSSDPAFELYEELDNPDLSTIPRTGHSGRTYSKGDVKKAA